MFNVGPMEFAVIALVALVVLGPDKLPDAARQAGKWMSEFRKITTGFQHEMRSAMNEIADAGPTSPTSAPTNGSSPNGSNGSSNGSGGGPSLTKSSDLPKGPSLDKPSSGPVEGADS